VSMCGVCVKVRCCLFMHRYVRALMAAKLMLGEVEGRKW
jgi:hypothetical protein